MKYIFWISVILLSCQDKKEKNCSFPDWKVFSIYGNAASIKLPEELLKIKDTLSHSFEYDKNLLYSCRLYTSDSLNSAFITAHRAEYELNNKNLVEDLTKLEETYASLLKYQDAHFYQTFDTSNNKKIAEFILTGKKNNSDASFGGLVFFVGDNRFEILIDLNQKNMKTQNEVKCIFNSLRIIGIE